jgi:hypothetical protein
MRRTVTALLGAIVLAASAGHASAASPTVGNARSGMESKATAECQRSGGQYNVAAGVCELPGQ